jgi:hypothetical protein
MLSMIVVRDIVEALMTASSWIDGFARSRNGTAPKVQRKDPVNCDLALSRLQPLLETLQHISKNTGFHAIELCTL